jgi:hypothetical protein
MVFSYTHFHMSHQGLNDEPFQGVLSRFYSTICPDLNYTASFLLNPALALTPEKARIAFLSTHFYDHSIGRILFETIHYLKELGDFDIYIIFVQMNTVVKLDFLSEAYQRSFGDHFLRVERDVTILRVSIESLQLFALVYADIGMDQIGYLLSFSRLAKYQVMT